jgi:hypothetical protein
MASLDCWYIQDLARFHHEHLALVDLAAASPWLSVGVRRPAQDGAMVVELTIDVGHRDYHALLRYPTTFPASPPTVRPRDLSEHWTRHQYVNGDLCLEYRSDNWTPDISGAQIVESAYRLLSGENPAPGIRAAVPSAHALTEGQRLAHALSRLVLTASSAAYLVSLEPGQGGTGVARRFALHPTQSVWALASMQGPDSLPWADSDLPKGDLGDWLHDPACVYALASTDAFPTETDPAAFRAAAQVWGVTAETSLLVLTRGAESRAYYLGAARVFPTAVTDPPRRRRRLTDEHSGLASKTVAILGCGSIGSKVASSLARCGVGAFVLIDDDILTPENLVRHDLDWRSVGLHKVDALAARLDLVRANTEVFPQKTRLGGQISATEADLLLRLIARCNLIVDATGDPAVGNLLTWATTVDHVPIVWGEVFAGGFGGLVARHRQGMEPSIPLMRRAIENWFADYGGVPMPEAGDAEPYGQEIGDRVFVADDGDVSTIASTLTRMATDVLLARSPSHFLHSVYVLGMATIEPFTQALDTRPIALPPVEESIAPTVLTQEARDEALALLSDMLHQSTPP